MARALAANYSTEYIDSVLVTPAGTGWGARRADADALNAADGAGAALLARAEAALAAMPFFVIVERYDESLALVEHASCWRDDRHAPPPPRRADAGAIAPAALAAARRYFALDTKLYEYANALLDARLARMRRDRAAGVVCRLVPPLAASGCATVCFGGPS